MLAGAIARGKMEASLFNAESKEAKSVTELATWGQQAWGFISEMQMLETQYSTHPDAALANIKLKERIIQICNSLPDVLQKLEATRAKVLQEAEATKNEFQSFAQSTAE